MISSTPTFFPRTVPATTPSCATACGAPGKSSLLYRILERKFSDPRLVPVMFDMQGIDDEKHLYFSLAESISEALAIEPPGQVQGFGDFKLFAKHMGRVASDKIAVVLMDEFEELQLRVEDNRMSRTVFSHIRHLMQHEQKIVFLFCGAHKLEEMSGDYWSIFFNTALYLKINYLSRQDTEDLVRKPMEGHLIWDDLAVDRICKLTNGQPYLAQLICRDVVNRLNQLEERNHAVVNDVDAVAESIIEQGQDHFSTHIWTTSSPGERLAMSALAEELTRQGLERIGLDTLYDQVRKNVPAYSKKECVHALDRLVSRDILTQSHTGYSFPVDLLRKWIAARHPIRLVREEISGDES